ncbi:MAG TPA: hypothetical protein DD635_07600 [Flavobacteriales bacterium]|nr:hypothetical protein [Flavobacteriales bacterium]|tara:strand:+ start:2262 stop:3236 length:975 start_codon:yes stop_codon:yes gene_type:complete
MHQTVIAMTLCLMGWPILNWGQTDTPKLTAAEEKAMRSAAALASDTLIQESMGLFNIHFSQVQLSNWAAGGQSNISLLTKFDQNWNYNRGRLGWDSELHLAFGLLHRPEDRIIIKTDDRIEWSTKLGYRATNSGFITFMAHFRSQFAPGYAMENGIPIRDILNSSFLAPGYGVFAGGMDYKTHDSHLALFLAPITIKSTWVLDDSLSAAGAFGVEPGNRSRYEMGGYLKLNFKKDFSDEISYEVRLDLFSNFLDNPKNIDIYSDHVLLLKVNPWLSTSISATLIYDDDILLTKNPEVIDGILTPNIGPGLQLKQVLSVGLSIQI